MRKVIGVIVCAVVTVMALPAWATVSAPYKLTPYEERILAEAKARGILYSSDAHRTVECEHDVLTDFEAQMFACLDPVGELEEAVMLPPEDIGPQDRGGLNLLGGIGGLGLLPNGGLGGLLNPQRDDPDQNRLDEQELRGQQLYDDCRLSDGSYDIDRCPDPQN